MDRLLKVFATLGVGYLPILPGTVGTLLGIPLFWYLSCLKGPLYFLTVLAFTLFSWSVLIRALPLFRNQKKPQDPSCVVIDEVVGFLWAAGILEFIGLWSPRDGTVSFLILAFVFFRIFDIIKPWPIRMIERKLPGALGVIMDDVAAGICAGFASILFCIVYPFVVYLIISFR